MGCFGTRARSRPGKPLTICGWFWRIADATDRPVARRVAKLAAVNGRPEAPRSSDDCLAWYLERLEEAGAMGADLVCLGEVINIDGVPDGRQKVAELVPGPWTEAMGEAARRHRMWIGAGLQERSGRRRHNTCVLIDRQGALAGRYRKTHQTIGEQIFSGRFSGADFPVFDTDFGKVAMMICYDYHFPEVARLLALQGAEVILLPNMGDNREGGALWEPCVRTRALDNGVHIVAALNGGRSCVASPKGELLSIVGREKGAIAIADCEIGATLCDFTGRPIGRRYFRIRRADLFGQMMRHAWEYK